MDCFEITCKASTPESRSQQDEGRINQPSNQPKEVTLLAEDADSKSDTVSRKLAFIDEELAIAKERVRSRDAKLVELEELLTVIGGSLKSLKVCEENANQTVDEFKQQLKILTVKLKEAEARAEFAEKTSKKLQKEIDKLEGELTINKDRHQSLNNELNSSLSELDEP